MKRTGLFFILLFLNPLISIGQIINGKVVNYNNSDSLNDYRMIEFSPDNGITWIDLLNDTEYSSYYYWQPPKPVLTGNSNGWQRFYVNVTNLGAIFNLAIQFNIGLPSIVTVSPTHKMVFNMTIYYSSTMWRELMSWALILFVPQHFQILQKIH